MTDNRVIEFQRLSLVRQQEHLDEALRRMREAERRAAELLAELELAHEHNTVLVAMAQRDRRLLQALRAELAQVRGILGEELR